MRYSLYLFITLICLSGCKDRNDQVPYVPIDIFININEPDFFPLSGVSGWVYLTGGSRGIIVYRRNIDEFVAFDRHSPFNASEGCRVDVQDDNIIVTDPCSGSQWLITDGSVVNGPAATSLEQYDAVFVNPQLHIFN